MVEETFIAPTPKEAFRLAKEKYGEFSRLKLIKAKHILDRNGKLMAEIVVEVDEDSYFKSIDIDMEKELIEEISNLRDRVSNMKSLLSGEKNSIIEKVIQIFVNKGIKKEWIDNLIKELIDTSIVSDEKLLISYILESIDNLLHIKDEDLSKEKIMMLVGTTGVGKTTTIAKLVSRYKDKDIRPLVINLDTYKIGAFERLEAFAQLLNIEHRYIKDIEEFSKILDTIQLYPITIIDTAGISPYDINKLIRIIEFIKNIKNLEISLVIPVTSKYRDLTDIYESFSFLNLDNVILTKFDETQYIGDVISFLIETQIPVSYMSIGEDISDLEVATKERLLEKFVGEANFMVES